MSDEGDGATPLIARLLITHYSSLITHYSSLITHYALLQWVQLPWSFAGDLKHRGLREVNVVMTLRRVDVKVAGMKRLHALALERVPESDARLAGDDRDALGARMPVRLDA